MGYKKNKVLKIIREINYSGNQYLINGIDLSLSTFFIKKNRELFKLVAGGDFTITHEGTNVYLVINQAILVDVVSIQICYELNTISGKYETGSEPDINILVANYNKVVDDIKNLWLYIQNQVFVSDTLNASLILPMLSNGETWIYKDGEMKAIILYDAIEELKKSVEEIRTDILNELETKITEFNTQINNQITDFRQEIQNIINNFNNDVIQYKAEFRQYIEEGKSELNEIIIKFKNDWAILVENSKHEINEVLENSINDLENVVETSKIDVENFVDEQKMILEQQVQIYINNMSEFVQTSLEDIQNKARNEKNEIRELGEQAKEDIITLINNLAGFDPFNFYTKSEIDNMNFQTEETIMTLFEGEIQLFEGDFANCEVPGVLLGVTKGRLIITFGDPQLDWFDVEIPFKAIENDKYSFYIPMSFYQDISSNPFIFLFAGKTNDSLKLVSTNYTGISSALIKKIRHIKN